MECPDLGVPMQWQGGTLSMIGDYVNQLKLHTTTAAPDHRSSLYTTATRMQFRRSLVYSARRPAHDLQHTANFTICTRRVFPWSARDTFTVRKTASCTRSAHGTSAICTKRLRRSICAQGPIYDRSRDRVAGTDRSVQEDRSKGRFDRNREWCASFRRKIAARICAQLRSTHAAGIHTHLGYTVNQYSATLAAAARFEAALRSVATSCRSNARFPLPTAAVTDAQADLCTRALGHTHATLAIHKLIGARTTGDSRPTTYYSSGDPRFRYLRRSALISSTHSGDLHATPATTRTTQIYTAPVHRSNSTLMESPDTCQIWHSAFTSDYTWTQTPIDSPAPPTIYRALSTVIGSLVPKASIENNYHLLQDFIYY